MVAIQRQISTKVDQAYALRMQFPGALHQGAELRVEWGGETIAQLSSADVTRAQGITLEIVGVYRREPASGSASVSHRPRDFTTPTLGARTLSKSCCGVAALVGRELVSM